VNKAIAISPTGDGEVTHRIRKIKNGYIHTASSFDGRGKYKSEETFHPKPPVMTVPEQPAPMQRGITTQRGSGTQKTDRTQKMNKPMPLSKVSKAKGAI